MRTGWSDTPALRRTAVVCGALTALVTVFLLADGIAEWGRVAREEAVIAPLEEAILTDAEANPRLEEERQRVTARTVARRARNHRLAWALLIAASAFLIAAKRLQALRGEPPVLPAGSERWVQLGAAAAEADATRVGPSPASSATAAATAGVDLAFVDLAVARHGSGREATIPILQALQTHYRYLPLAALRRVCELTELTPADLVGVASFYSQFRRTPVGRHLVRICHGTACHVAGIGPITDELRRRLEIPEAGDSDAEMRFTLDPVNCLGCCSLAPVLMVDDRVAGRLTPTSAFAALAAAEADS